MLEHPDPAAYSPFTDEMKHGARIKVVGAGGGGSSAVNRMIESGMAGVEFISMNTDRASLQDSKAPVRLQLGARLTRGLGTGADAEVGRRAALEDSEKIMEALDGADMVVLAAGLGGGTGTGAAPVIASLASQMGALVVALVTRPFAFEGKRRMDQAEEGVEGLLEHTDTLIVIPNERLLASSKETGFLGYFQIADEVLRQAAQGISDIMTANGLINRDFADVRTTLAGMGHGAMGMATRTGPNRAAQAAIAAITSPLLEPGAIDGARGILINITGPSSLKMSEVSEASTIIQSAAHEDANIIFGAVLDERLTHEIKVIVIATGFREESRDRAERRSQVFNYAEQPTIQFEDPSPRSPYIPIALFAATAQTLGLETAETSHGEASGTEVVQTFLIVRDALSNGDGNDPPASQELYVVDRVMEEAVSTTEEAQETLHDAMNFNHSNESFEADVLANIDGPDFNWEDALEEPVHNAAKTPPAQPELIRLRQTAIAAYAASASTEAGVKAPATSREAEFARILANCDRALGSILTSYDGNLGGNKVDGGAQPSTQPIVSRSARN